MATKWGCMGAGKIANDFFTAIKYNLPADEHELVALAARDQKRAQALVDKLGFERAYGSYDDLINDAEVSVDENACIILKYKDGAMANLIYHISAGVGENNAVIYGDKGKIQVGSPIWCPTKITTPSGSYEFPLKEDGGYNFINCAEFQYEAAAVRDALNSGAKEVTEASHSQSIMIVAIMDEVRRQLGVKFSAD